MKNTFLLIVLIFIGFGCGNKGPEPVSEWDSIQANTYYDTDILENIPIYGKWEVIGTSGGKTGMGYEQDFDFLLMKPNGIFGLLKNNDLITSGKISLLPTADSNLIPPISFSPEKKLDIQILFDSIKLVKLVSDTLYLNSPCCDRYNTQLKKVE